MSGGERVTHFATIARVSECTCQNKQLTIRPAVCLSALLGNLLYHTQFEHKKTAAAKIVLDSSNLNAGSCRIYCLHTMLQPNV